MYIAAMVATPPRFSISIAPTADDIDELGHVSNLVYLRWVQDVATAHSAALGWDMARYRAHGAVFVVRRHELDYLVPVTLGQTLRADTWVESWRAASCVRRTELWCGDVVVARGATTWAMVGFATGRLQRIPEDIVAEFHRAP